ncbi:MAG TPA: pilus assembly protein TadG-related protein [Gemmatimonadales bacterium]|jgi:hypothetical protein
MPDGRKGSHRRQGATLVLVAMAMITVGTVAALAIDLGMLFKARSDAQRAAEAGALAGASAFVDFALGNAVDVDSVAGARANQYAESNGILNVAVTAAEDSFEVITDSQKVRVWVRREQVGTWFAKLLGVSSVPIGAKAAAVAVSASSGGCTKPIAVPDTWRENGDDTNGDQLEEDGETWTYTPGPDTYDTGNPDTPASGAGYGSNVRDDGTYLNDLGRPLTLKLPDPAATTPNLGPRQFLPFSISGNPNDYRDELSGCGDAVNLGTPYDLLPPSTQTPVSTQEVVDSLVNQADPGAHWDPQTKTIQGSAFGDWRSSPRTIKFGLFDPVQLVPGQTQVTLNNIGLMFLEGYDPTLNALTGRFLYFASGTGDPIAGSGTLIKRLRLVE